MDIKSFILQIFNEHLLCAGLVSGTGNKRRESRGWSRIVLSRMAFVSGRQHGITWGLLEEG